MRRWRSTAAPPTGWPAPLTRAGVTENIFAKLDEDSTLTELQPGDNVLSMQAENGSGYLQASVSFYPMEAGILPEPL